MAKEYSNEVTFKLKKLSLKENLSGEDSSILIIYTGGTIGMVQSKTGYIPATNKFANALRQNPQFHDELQHQRRLITGNYSEDNFITPESFYKKRIIYKLIELTPLIDSSSMQMSNWVEIAEVVEKYYYDYDGFLILHGTDTMAYTASILSFILENLQKPVILTGSQIPYFEVRNDASKNLLEALTIAGHFNIPEVGLYFNNKLFRGNRSTKIDNSGFNSFDSPNCGYLVKSGISFKVKWDHIRHPRVEGRFCVQRVLEENISIIHFFPIITLQSIRSALQEPTKAVVILSYGAGNIPSNKPEIIEEFKKANERGLILLNITQCVIGGTSDFYECGRILTEAGVVLGSDMTLECAVTKLSYLLGKFPGQNQVIKRMLRNNLRGELSNEDKTQLAFSYSMQNVIDSIGNSFGLYSQIEKVEVLNKCLTMIAHNAVDEGLLEEIMRLCDENVSMNLKNSQGKTLLHVACRTGNVKIVEFLLSKGVFVNPIDASGNTPLLLAIQRDFIKISEKVIEKGGEIKGKPEYISFLLNDAVVHGNLTKINLLVQAGVNINLKDFQGRNAGHAAVIVNQIAIVEYLKNYQKFDWNEKDCLGNRPLDLALQLQRIQIIEILTIN